MKTKQTLGIVVLILLNLSACNPSRNAKKEQLSSEKDHPVKEVFLSGIEAFNQGNLDAFVSNFSKEITMYGTDGNYEGKEALRTRFATLFQQFPNMKMEIPSLKVEVLSEAVVLVDFGWKLYPIGQGPAYSGVGSGIYVNRQDTWIEILEVERTTHVDPELIPRN
ncbi:nuclear transport factor 2 family protein [Flagellimonas allohymeniacidonis]|uniref:Nuclear transport factor 2 family protein n=1 Tax=Flagellimonas allohymeniacidonis TaxID=2517819 RepID=A0A4Q8QGM0_9FLAO|nr:nuclear transport factor 2 family protein [Allomuricauda hymeniacidonis]TAI47266.1 nuclear transport factor 2 family protein [Allomuricauda hymeniacidonis]